MQQRNNNTDNSTIQLRKGMPRFCHIMTSKEPITAAFLGGSITEGAGASNPDATSWRALTEKYFQARLGKDRVTCINAGVGGTNSAFGAHRLAEHVLMQGPIDVLFVEFAVNDDLDREASIRGMEGIVRKCLRESPHTEICFIYTAADKNLGGRMPFNIAVHEEIAAYYSIPSVNFAAEIYNLIAAGQTSWEELAPDHYHPNDQGHALYANCLIAFLQEVERKHPAVVEAASETVSEATSEGTAVSFLLSRPPLDGSNYEFARMGKAEEISELRGFEMTRLDNGPLINWRYDTAHLLTYQADATFTFTVHGQSAGICMLCGPDTGIFEYSVNEEPFQSVNLFDEWSLLAYRPVIAIFPVQKDRRQMTVTVRNTGRKDDRSTGISLRIMKWLVN